MTVQDIKNIDHYATLTFKTRNEALKNERDIKSYFADCITESAIEYGTDERGNTGYFVRYSLAE